MKKNKYLNNIDNIEHNKFMGGDVLHNRGASQPSNTIYKYYSILRKYAINKYQWFSNILDSTDLNLIEYNIFNYNIAYFVKPIIIKNNNKIKLKIPRVVLATPSFFNNRTGEPLKLNVVNNVNNNGLMFENIYSDFGYITSQKNLLCYDTPLTTVTREYANKLYELDLLFNANSTKQRLPILFQGDPNSFKDSGGNTSSGFVIQNAVNANQQFVEIPFSQNGLLHHTNQYNENNLQNYIETQRLLYNEYFELLGIQNYKESHGTYTAKDTQLQQSQNVNYRSELELETRIKCATILNSKFDLDLKCVEKGGYNV